MKNTDNLQVSFFNGMKAGVETFTEALKPVADANNGQVSFDFIKTVSERTIAEVETKMKELDNGSDLLSLLNMFSK